MKKLETILSTFLNDIGRIEDIKLGGKVNQLKHLSDDDTARLTGQLSGQSKFNRTILVIYIISLCVLYAIGIFMVFYFLDSPEKIGIVFGGSFLGLLAIGDRLYKIWREKTVTDVLLTLIQGLPPIEAVKAIESIYWAQISRSRK